MNFANLFLSLSLIFSLSIHGYSTDKDPEKSGGIKQEIKKYKLNSKIQMGSGKNFGEYIPEKDIITLRPSYKTYKEFLLTILHEIKHALDAKRLGKRK